jgi:putative transposase
MRLVELAREKPRFGYRRLQVLLRRRGEFVNHKRVHRVYREAGLALRRKKRKHCARQSAPLRQYTAANQEWALDFAHDAIAAGRAIRVLSVVDAYTRECLALEVDTSFASRRVTRVLEQIIEHRGEPRAIRCDNGPELTSRHFLAWCIEKKIELVHIQPGEPTQNAHVESFHGRLREECLRVSWFQNLFDARRKIALWRRDYNEQRPHSSLNYRAPAEFARETSYGKDAGFACLENASGCWLSKITMRKMGAGQSRRPLHGGLTSPIGNTRKRGACQSPQWRHCTCNPGINQPTCVEEGCNSTPEQPRAQIFLYCVNVLPYSQSNAIAPI